jgi:hypothetical protein
MRAGPIRITDKMADPAFVAALPTSRKAAKELGVSMYLASSCRHGHVSYRLTKNGNCAQCASNLSSRSGSVAPASRKRTNARWNSSEGAKTAKDRWKARDPKWAWVVGAVGGARVRAKYSGLDFDLTNDYVASLTPDTCPALGVPLSFGGTGRPVAESASIDRIDPAKGYVIGNVAVISRRANAIKSDATAEEIMRVAQWVATRMESA